MTGKGSVTEKVLRGEHTCFRTSLILTEVAPFILSYQWCTPHQGQRERNEGHEGESILFFHAFIPKTQPFNLKHRFYSLKSLQVNKSKHSFQNPACLALWALPVFSVLRWYPHGLWNICKLGSKSKDFVTSWNSEIKTTTSTTFTFEGQNLQACLCNHEVAMSAKALCSPQEAIWS